MAMNGLISVATQIASARAGGVVVWPAAGFHGDDLDAAAVGLQGFLEQREESLTSLGGLFSADVQARAGEQ